MASRALIMAMVTIFHRVRRWTRGDFTGWQVLERVTCVCGVPIWSKEIDREDVPSWAYIQRACLGHTEWKSRLFEQYADLFPD